MTLFSNYHCHTHFSDGTEEPEKYVETAIKLGLHSLGFSEHGPVPFTTNWNMKPENIDTYFFTINNLKKKYVDNIQIYCGLELDYISGCNHEILNSIKSQKWDYLLASIHFLGQLKNGSHWNIDATAEMFEEGMREVFENNGEKLVKTYFAEICRMVETYKPQIIGHIDKIKMHNEGNRYFDEEGNYYKAAIMQSLEVIKKYESIIEFNTRGLYRHQYRVPYPSQWMLQQMYQKGIRVMVNSDSHKPAELVNEFTAAYEMLKAAGYKTSWRMNRGTWEEVEF